MYTDQNYFLMKIGTINKFCSYSCYNKLQAKKTKCIIEENKFIYNVDLYIYKYVK